MCPGLLQDPVDDLYALPVLCQAIEEKAFPDLVVVSPDAGFAKKARKFATGLRAPLAIADKQRTDHSERAEILSIMGDVTGRTAVLVDDFVISGGTLIQAALALRERGARTVYAAVSHGVLTQRSLEVLQESPIDLLFVTNTVEPQASGCRPSSRWYRWRRCSARRSAGSTSGRASASCSIGRAARWPAGQRRRAVVVELLARPSSMRCARS